MAMLLQMATFIAQYLYGTSNTAPKQSDALRIGILSTATINSAALINPAKSHGGVIVSAVASRTLEQAQKYAQQYDIPNAYGSYDELLNEPGIDAVYISLPNGMHGTWAKKALNAGKHVLLEKPFTANGDEARSLVQLAVEKRLILVEAFHWQFHPAAHVLKATLSSGKYGPIQRTSARMTSPQGSIPRTDVRWQLALAGGSLMDMTYVLSATRYFLGASASGVGVSVGTPREVAEATARPAPHDAQVDEAMEATLLFDVGPGGRTVESRVYSDMWREHVWGVVPRIWETPSIEIETEHAVIYFYNFMMPHLYHYIAVYDKRTGTTTTEKHYSGGPQWGARGETWWSTYRYQLEAFVDMVRGREPAHWITLASSIAQMDTIDMVYEKAGLGRRMPTPE